MKEIEKLFGVEEIEKFNISNQATITNELQEIQAEKLTENNDDAFSTTGNKLLDIFFMSEYYQKHLDEVKIGTTKLEKLFAMFIRDGRHGLGRRDLGRQLMKLAEVKPEDVVKAGRFDDLLTNPTDEALNFWKEEILKGNQLAKKWAPRRHTKNHKIAKKLATLWFGKDVAKAEKQYRLATKLTSTVEYKLTHKEDESINFEHVPSLAMLKYFKAFERKQPERFAEYLKSVKKGEKKLNVSTTNVYDIYRNRNDIDAQLFFDKLEKIEINALPILDTSGSMQDRNDSMGKAISIAHYISKNSTYAKDTVISFSSNPVLIKLGKNREGVRDGWFGGTRSFTADKHASNYINEVNSMITGDYTNTDFGKVMELLKGLKEDLPQYLVVLSDMEFDYGSNQSKKELMESFKERNIKTRIVWINLNARNMTVPELDKDGNIYMSGYSPYMLKYLEAGFNGAKFLEKLLEEYNNKIK